MIYEAFKCTECLMLPLKNGMLLQNDIFFLLFWVVFCCSVGAAAFYLLFLIFGLTDFILFFLLLSKAETLRVIKAGSP